MKPVEGYENLSEVERKIFILAHNKHLSSLKGNERDQYGLGSIVEVKANLQQTAVAVRFLNGEQWQFTAGEYDIDKWYG